MLPLQRHSLLLARRSKSIEQVLCPDWQICIKLRLMSPRPSRYFASPLSKHRRAMAATGRSSLHFLHQFAVKWRPRSAASSVVEFRVAFRRVSMAALCARGRARLSPLHWLSAALLLIAIVAPRPQARLRTRAKRSSSFSTRPGSCNCRIAPPRSWSAIRSIADLSIQPGGLAVVTGKGYGATNFIVMDRKGAVLMEKNRRGDGARAIRPSWSIAAPIARPIAARRIARAD